MNLRGHKGERNTRVSSPLAFVVHVVLAAILSSLRGFQTLFVAVFCEKSLRSHDGACFSDGNAEGSVTSDQGVGVGDYQSGASGSYVGRFANQSTLKKSALKFGKVPERAATRRNFRGVFGERVKKRIDEGRFVLFYRTGDGKIRKKRKKTKWIFATIT